MTRGGWFASLNGFTHQSSRARKSFCKFAAQRASVLSRFVVPYAGIIKADPSIDAYTSDIVKEALAGITDDTIAKDFKKGTVEVTAGGK